MSQKSSEQPTERTSDTTRRRFLQTSVAGAGAFMGRWAFGAASPTEAGPRAPSSGPQPNFLFVICDQLGLDALAAHGCPDVHTPNMDRLVNRGVSFMESYSTNPLCSPARSSFFTGRMPVETGVVDNGLAIRAGIPRMGAWFRQAGYETAYSGKWHLPGPYQPKIDGFTVLPAGVGEGDLVDTVTSRSCQAFLRNRRSDAPFLLVASFVQPHDICWWAINSGKLLREDLPFPQLRDRLPELPPNHKIRPEAPKVHDARIYRRWSDLKWRYYLYIYYRQIEMVDAEIGRVLDALDQSGQADNTIVVFTADHGEGRGRHRNVQKWFPYDEAAKVPLIVSCPGRIPEKVKDATHLVSGLDIMSTLCDYAGLEAPRGVLGKSLRPLLEDKPVEWRDYLVYETHFTGRTVRTPQFKYVTYEDDPVEQLFDMKADPWETQNLYKESQYADVMRQHRQLLGEWQARLSPAPQATDVG